MSVYILVKYTEQVFRTTAPCSHVEDLVVFEQKPSWYSLARERVSDSIIKVWGFKRVCNA
jgi:hypothetical protein